MTERACYVGLAAAGGMLALILLAGLLATSVLAEEAAKLPPEAVEQSKPAAGAAKPLTPPKPSFPMVLTSQDLSALREICQLAQRSERLTLEQATNVGVYCTDLLVRMGNALSTRETPSTPPETGK